MSNENHAVDETDLFFHIYPNWTKEFPVNGQGTLIFNIVRNSPFVIVIRGKNHPDKWIALKVNESEVKFLIKESKKEQQKLLKSETSMNIGFERNKMISYWFSYDRDNLALKYGKGYIMEETTLLMYSFIDDVKDVEAIRRKYKDFFNAEEKLTVHQYDHMPPDKMKKAYKTMLNEGNPYLKPNTPIPVKDLRKRSVTVDAISLIDIEGKVEFDPDPFVHNRSPFIKDSEKITLFDLEENVYTFSASLPRACRELYQNVKNCNLDCAPDVNLPDAIRYSIVTKGCTLYEKIKSKSSEFGAENINETYLRVTLGCSFGQSPGIPYVLEIWPSGHYSPIHNHGNACAVIKVIHGCINVKIYNKLTSISSPKPIRVFKATKGQFTWISRNWFQTHQLQNISNDYCATIQCYMYDTEDKICWPYFDYLGDQQHIDEFLPNSDFTFHEMSKLVLKEFEQSKTRQW